MFFVPGFLLQQREVEQSFAFFFVVVDAKFAVSGSKFLGGRFLKQKQSAVFTNTEGMRGCAFFLAELRCPVWRRFLHLHRHREVKPL